MQLNYYKLLAKTSSYILSFVYKARKRVISKDNTPTTYKQVLKLPRDKYSKYLITCRNVLKVKKDAKNRPIKYKSRLVARGFIQVEGLDYTITYASTSILPTWRILLAIAAFNKAISKLLLEYSYSPSTPNIIKLSQELYRVLYNAKTCHFIDIYIDDCLFKGPNIGYITDLKKRLNKVYAIEDLGPAAYFLGNGNTVADLGPKLSNSSNTTTKLSRDFYSKEGPRPLTTTSTTIVDSRNGDKATSKSTYSYLYKLASRPISWKTKRATTIALSTLEAETNRLTEAIHEVQTKHTLLKFRYVREQVKAKIVTIIYLNTKSLCFTTYLSNTATTITTTTTTSTATPTTAITTTRSSNILFDSPFEGLFSS
ncbi:hypothetical protein P8C59_000161 [Phyllachora maydis]|uniref:Reverse transcriptase Ty1/copia-type domain-containing protein n=1 Tax=Phyllachora maydis TaxID=1825666 RepID=A0AAD9M765_9PEZI|nr:hypothetical protein P8C59_000161 [Phyllachora maydis]